MKTTAFFLALFLFIKPMVPVVEYVVFYDYIKEVLCINKDKVEMQCNGKCFLKKELANSSEGSENSKKKDGRTVSFENTIVFYQEIKSPFILISQISNTKLDQDYFYNNLYSLTTIDSIFHPPLSV